MLIHTHITDERRYNNAVFHNINPEFGFDICIYIYIYIYIYIL